MRAKGDIELVMPDCIWEGSVTEPRRFEVSRERGGMPGCVHGQIRPQTVVFSGEGGERRAESYVHEPNVIMEPLVIGTDVEVDLDAQVVLALI